MTPLQSSNEATLLTAHPSQLGVQDWATYALILDARPHAQYDEDHIPGAVCADVASPSIGRGSKASAVGVQRTARSRSGAKRQIPASLTQALASLSAGSSVLLYGDGEGDALVTHFGWLRARGLVVDILEGGWASYRRWVDASLELLPRLFTFRVLTAPAASGVEQVSDALCSLGQQTMDIGMLLPSDRWPGAPDAARPRLSQAAFETWLVDTLRHRETHTVVWLIEALDLPETLRFPPAMREAVVRAPVTNLRVPRIVRARAWVERLARTPTARPSVSNVNWPGASAAAHEALAAAFDHVSRGHLELATQTLVDSCLDDDLPAALPGKAGGDLHLDSLDGRLVEVQVERWLAAAGLASK